MPQLTLSKEFLPYSPCSPSNQSVFPRRSGQGGFVSWQLALGSRRTGGEAQHTPCSHPSLMLLLAFPLTAEERSSTAPGKAALKEREAFNARNILKVSMKPGGKRSQLRVLLGGCSCCLSLRSCFYPGGSGLVPGSHQRGALSCSSSPHSYFCCYTRLPFRMLFCIYLFIYLISAIDSLGEEHAAAWAEPAGSLCCSASWQHRADAALPGSCKDPEGKGEPGEAKMESSSGLRANPNLCWVRGFVTGGCESDVKAGSGAD